MSVMILKELVTVTGSIKRFRDSDRSLALTVEECRGVNAFPCYQTSEVPHLV